MSLTIKLDDALARQLRVVAGEEGVDPATFAASAIREEVSSRSSQASAPVKTLLSEIARELPRETWTSYRALQAKQRSEELTEAERSELLRLIDVVENWHAHRLTLVGELSETTGESVPSLMHRLGLFTPIDA